MIYFRVPATLDQKRIFRPGKSPWFLVHNELYTEKECIFYGINPAQLEKVNVSKRKIYWFFGARFEYMEE